MYLHHFYFHQNYSSSSNFLALLGVLATLIVGWGVYRYGLLNERRNTISAIKTELNIHRLWFRTPWAKGNYARVYAGKCPIVFKVSTTAIDNAIIKGTSLFINSRLIAILGMYRQRLANFNQYIDIADAMRSNISNPTMAKNLESVLEVAHEDGIGTESTHGMNSALALLDEAIKDESSKPYLRWLLLGSQIKEVKDIPKSDSSASVS